jgi:serine/threonine protein kinase
MGIDLNKAESIFFAALDEPEGSRSRFIDRACGDDIALKRQIELLIAARSEAESFLEQGALSLQADPDDLSALNSIGTQVGPYKIREQIGEGGMGVVYVAEQVEPVRRKVALKIIKPGMATKDVVARFKAERQALAMMDHPHIASVFDGGVTDAGQPYFVMELVQGVPITEYCDDQRLDTRQRLRLFLKVCRAVHHAHQKGVIHRDVKPSNILVPEVDGTAVPKVIDFGVAKAIDQKLTEQTLYTQFTQLVGTPLYMSPEQAGRGVIDIDTRSDVYSRGFWVESLAGRT